MNKAEPSQAESSVESLKTQIASAGTVSHVAGHTEKSDEWFQIGLSNLEVVALKSAQEIVWAPADSKRATNVIDSKFATDMEAATLRILFVEALAHLDVLLPLILDDAVTMRQQGRCSISVFLDEIINKRRLAQTGASPRAAPVQINSFTNDAKQGRGESSAASVKTPIEKPAPAPALAARAQKPFRFPAQPQEWKLVSLRECPVDLNDGDTPGLLAEYWRKHVRMHPYFIPECECLAALMLSAHRKIKGHYLVGVGLSDSVLVRPLEVYRPAVVAGASSVVLVHNHPSGDPTPSQADIIVTTDLMRAGQSLKIELLDHLIMGHAGYVSLRQSGYFENAPQNRL
jgi:hypothetical protein